MVSYFQMSVMIYAQVVLVQRIGSEGNTANSDSFPWLNSRIVLRARHNLNSFFWSQGEYLRTSNCASPTRSPNPAHRISL